MARAMKDSGIEWIGKIPEDWEMTRMKSCISERDVGSWGEEPTGGEGDVICLRIADFDYSKFKFKDVDDISELTKRNYNIDIINKLALKKNDIVIEKSGGGEKTPVGRTVIFDKEYTALYANFCDRLRCREIVSPNFMQYVFVTFYVNRFVWNYIKQTTGIQNLDLTSMLSKEYIYTPHRKEQQKIANFLDSKCASIDAVIEKTKASIEEYKKLKQAIITKAVTRGIKKDIVLKNSGVHYIGEIPSNWGVCKFKQIISKKIDNRGRTPDILDNNEGIPLVEVASLGGRYPDLSKVKKYISIESHDKFIRDDVMKGDILVTTVGATIGKCSIVDEANFCIAQNLVGYRVEENQIPSFWYYYFQSDVFQDMFAQYDKGNTINNVKISDMEQGYIVIVPKNEQEEIVSYLDKKIQEMNMLISKKEHFLLEVDKYKKSLIFEYVTGKKEILL